VIGTLEPDFLRGEFRWNKYPNVGIDSSYYQLGVVALFSTLSAENASDH